MKIVILAAGFGSRLWPLSTPEKPKQFQPLLDGRSPLQYTYELFSKVAGKNELYVLTLQGLEHLAREQLPANPTEHVICVPARRNTLPHTLFALSTLPINDDEAVLFTTVDHLILQEAAFVDSIAPIINQAAQGLQNVTLLGNQSDCFDSNAGYFTIGQGQRIFSFKEKPTQQDIDRLTKDNASVFKDTAMFIASKKTFAAALATFSGEESVLGQALLAAPVTEQQECFLAMPFVDIATGFYEKATNLSAVFTAGDFIDLGSFGSLYKIGNKDEQGNVITGKVILNESARNNYIFNQIPMPLTVIGVHDSVIVQGETGTVIAPKNEIDAIGAIYKSQIYTAPAAT